MNRETTVQMTGEVLETTKSRAAAIVFDAVDRLNVSYIHWDADLRFVYGNRRWLTGFRYYLGENCPNSASVFDLIHPLVEAQVILVPDGTTAEAFEEQILEAIQFQAKGFAVFLKDGISLSLYTHPAPEGGCMTYFRENEAYADNEADRDQNQSALAHSRLSEALDSIDEGFILYDKISQTAL